MFRFKHIKAQYNFLSEIMTPAGGHSVYPKTEQVEALPNWVEGLNFFLKGSIVVLTGGSPTLLISAQGGLVNSPAKNNRRLIIDDTK